VVESLRYNRPMTNTICDQKARRRKQCKAIRKELGDETRRAASHAICARLVGWDIFQNAKTILTYMPMRTEVDLRSLFTEFPEKRWLIPRILPGEEGRMVFHPYDPDNLILHPFGMVEPAQHLPQVSPSEVQLVLVPGLAFDHSGWRLGYGGGFYDRFLAGFEGVSVGIVFQALLLDMLPHDEYDVPVDWVVCEGKFFEVNKG